MIRRFAQHWTRLGRRRASSLLLAVSLNLAIMPCAMALEVVEQGHDCCPPEIQLDAAECCELDDVSVDTRKAAAEHFGSPDFVALPVSASFRDLDSLPTPQVAVVDPPGPPGSTPPLHKLFCVYLR